MNKNLCTYNFIRKNRYRQSRWHCGCSLWCMEWGTLLYLCVCIPPGAVHMCTPSGFSDNGPAKGTPGSTNGLRGRKGTVYEGGVRVPGLIEWPAMVQENRRVDTPIVSSDLLPTVLELLGLEMPDDVSGDFLVSAIIAHFASSTVLRDCGCKKRSGQSVTASDFGSNGPRFESGRGRCVESLDKALYSHCPKEKPSH